MALKFENPASFIISGPSGVRKTKWILHFLDNIDKICSALKFENPASFIISGPFGVRKTKWILHFLDNIDKICSGINQIFCCYEVWLGTT